MAKHLVLCTVSVGVWLALLAALLFGSAGSWDLPWFWAYLGLWLAASVVGTWVMDPGLARERLRPGPGGQGYGVAFIVFPVWAGQHVVAGLDVGRWHYTDNVPPVVQEIGLLAMAAAVAVMLWAVAVNRFFSSVIRIQTDRGHHVVTNGPYRYLRHPAYAAAPFLFVGAGLLLGSWLAAALGLVLASLIWLRAEQEDRILREQLEGYADYAQRVRYRLFPGIW